MARAHLIEDLVEAGLKGDTDRVRQTANVIIAQAWGKERQHALAKRLRSQLDANHAANPPKPTTQKHTLPLRSPPRSSKEHDLLAETIPQRRLDDLILPPNAEETIQELISEQQFTERLRSYNLEPRNRILLAGPPGNGKTTLAEAIAYTLDVPLLAVRYDAVIRSHLGETAQRISKIFDHVNSKRCVLFLDEFETISKERGDTHETGEIKRVVSTLLLQIDAIPSHVVIVTASNHPELFDRAVWRRFQVRLELPAPGQPQIETWFNRFEKQHKIGCSPQMLAKALAGASFAEVEEFGIDILRKIALAPPGTDAKHIVEQRLSFLKERYGPDLSPAKQPARPFSPSF